MIRHDDATGIHATTIGKIRANGAEVILMVLHQVATSRLDVSWQR